MCWFSIVTEENVALHCSHETHPRDEDKEKLTMRVTRSENEFIPDETNDPRLIEFVFIHIHMCVRVVCTHGGTSAATKTDIPS
jgi:hypothetical protein